MTDPASHSDFNIDLQSVYAAYLGLFDKEGVDWWDKSWGGYFRTFNDFLSFGWETTVVVDQRTGKGSVGVRKDQVASFAKMIRTRFGEGLSKSPPTMLVLDPFVPSRRTNTTRILDLTTYRRLASAIPAAELTFNRTRLLQGDPVLIQRMFAGEGGQEYTFACVRTTWWDRGGSPSGMIPGLGWTPVGSNGQGVVLEIGIAALRNGHLKAQGVWPAVPQDNYRKSHFIVEEWVDKRTNIDPPSCPRAYAFHKSRFVAERDIEKVIDASVSALMTHEIVSSANKLVLLTMGGPEPLVLPKTSTIPQNILHIDLLQLEYNIRMASSPGTPQRSSGPWTSLSSLLQCLEIPISSQAPIRNAGNEAFYTLLPFQKLLMGTIELPGCLRGRQSLPSYMPDPRLSFDGGLKMPNSRHASCLDLSLPNPGFAPRPRPHSSTHSSPALLGQEKKRSSSYRLSTAPRSQSAYWDDAKFAWATTDAEEVIDPQITSKSSGSSRANSVAAQSTTSVDSPLYRTTADSAHDLIRPHYVVPRTVSWASGNNLDAPIPPSQPPGRPGSALPISSRTDKSPSGSTSLRSAGSSSSHEAVQRPSMFPTSSSQLSLPNLAARHVRRSSGLRTEILPRSMSTQELSPTKTATSASRFSTGPQAKKPTVTSKSTPDDGNGGSSDAKPVNDKKRMTASGSLRNIAGAVVRFWVG